jgi:hypothetical protein
MTQRHVARRRTPNGTESSEVVKRVWCVLGREVEAQCSWRGKSQPWQVQRREVKVTVKMSIDAANSDGAIDKLHLKRVALDNRCQ